MRSYCRRFCFFALAVCLLPLAALFFPDSTVPSPAALSDGHTVYRVLNHETGIVMELSPMEYITGVVAAEMPISFHPEALKAQAVAAHTYALRQMGSARAASNVLPNDADLSTDPAVCQAWISVDAMKEAWGDSFDASYALLTEAVSAVIGQILTYEDAPIIAAFHALSSGETESAETVWGSAVPYLIPVDSMSDRLSPSFHSTVIVSRAEAEQILRAAFPDALLPADPAAWIALNERSASGTVTALAVGGAASTGQELRRLFSLPSANFTVQYADDAFTFTCAGYGHGVGMSQYGADALARQGMSYDAILAHYYPGTTLTALDGSSPQA